MTTSASTSTHNSDSDSDFDFSARPPSLHSLTGTPRTWRYLTQHERALARSLDALQDADLSIHLYNAHALKRRLYIPDAGTAAVTSSSSDDDSDADAGSTPLTVHSIARAARPLHHAPKARWLPASAWRPPPSWTAWPVPAWCAERAARSVVQELHDCITASMSCRARAAYAQREDATPGDDDNGGIIEPEGTTREATERDATDSAVPRRARSETSGADAGTQDGGRQVDRRTGDSSSAHSPPRKRLRTRASDVAAEFMVPVPLADDDRIAQLLGPHARHTVSRIEELLLALHRAREAQDDSGSGSSADSNSDGGDGAETNGQETETCGAGENRGSSASIQRGEKRRDTRLRPTRDWSEVLGMAALKGWDADVLGRARARCEALFGERMEFTELGNSEVSGRRERSYALGTTGSGPLERRQDSGPEDKEDDILERSGGSDEDMNAGQHEQGASQKCPIRGCAGFGKRYATASSFRRHMASQHGSLPAATRPLDIPPDLTYCPFTTCSLYRKVFAKPFRLNFHLKRKHGYIRRRSEHAATGTIGQADDDADDADDAELRAKSDNTDFEADEMLGGVHVDGFMKPIRARPGWKGKLPRNGRRDANGTTQSRKGKGKPGIKSEDATESVSSHVSE